jgi:SAM-dependent methyltransferase
VSVPASGPARAGGAARPAPRGLLEDTPQRDYGRKLALFNAFAEPELRRAIAALDLRPGMRVLDAGCGTGEALAWLREAVLPGGEVVGIELAAAHAAMASRQAAATVLQADLLQAPFAARSFDVVWCVNTINHLREPLQGVAVLSALLRPGGRIALGQSSLLPDMYFAWDARLERLVNEAVRRYYRDRYRLSERELAPVRSLVGVLRSAHLGNVTVHTQMIERVAPLRSADEAYLAEAIFRDTWGERLRGYLSGDDYAQLARLCDPRDPGFALRRPDFHFLQTFTLAVGEVAS